MRTLLVDNYDSYTYNLYQLIAQVSGTPPFVLYNDSPDWERLDLGAFEAAVISPGPGHPANRRDFGHSRTAFERTDLPVLGVCLGHQGLGLAYGAQVIRAPWPRHGHLTSVDHTGQDVFAGLPRGFAAVRYHSLCVAEPVPAELEAIAWSEDGVIMGLRHRHLLQWGVQFHPESIATEHGAHLIANFLDLARRTTGTRRPSLASERRDEPATGEQNRQREPLRMYALCIHRLVDTEQAFRTLYGRSRSAYWLDSARVEAGLSRFSFLGDASGPSGEVLTYRVGDGVVTVAPSEGLAYREPGTIFDALDRRLGRPVEGAEWLPFDLTGGYVGYLGYELKGDLGCSNAHRAETPDAVWLRADRFIAVDHLERRTYVVAMVEPRADDGTWTWIERTAACLDALPPAPLDSSPPAASETRDISRWLVRSRERYLADIEESMRQLRAGESYEICLTNKLRLPAPADDLDYYRRLRRLNPAPYAALLRLGGLTIFSSSPERFLRVERDRTVESKPIKGTAPRSANPEQDEELRRSLQNDDKTRAENLMIVDLLRNDLGRVCEVGTVTVPAFMATESYATVHQLVSTVRGRLRERVSAIGCVKACFPGGSMTGAPKLRTMEIIDALESEARGVYSGALGFFGFTGTADLSIVIRTAVRCGTTLTAGAGGAIVLGSDAVAEYDEMLLKAAASLQALPSEARDPVAVGGARG
jgi:para-aminobenzoate synthetase